MTNKSKIKNQKSKMMKGFTFVEVVVAVFVFVLIITSVALIFGSAFKSYRSGKAIQKDLEGAQQAMNIIAKTLRTSKIVDPVVFDPNASSITVFDYSQADGVGNNKECVKYEFVGNSLLSGAKDAVDEIACNVSITTTNMTTGMVTGNFYVVPSDDTVAGKVTVAAKVCPATGCTGDPRDEAKIQTTVSLRGGYEEIAP